MGEYDKTDRKVFPDWGALPVIRELPELLLRPDGQRIRTIEEWEEQRESLQTMLDRYMYGQTPPWPGKVKGKRLYREKRYHQTAVFERIRLTDEAGLSIEAEITRPDREGSFPVIVWNQFDEPEICPAEEEVMVRGYAILSFRRTWFAPDEEGCSEFSGGAFRQAYPDYQQARAVAIWAWGCSYCISYLADRSFAGPVIVTGFSRGGKAALRAGAYDQRIAVTAPVCSGMGGAGSIRHLRALRNCGILTGESLGEMLGQDRFWYWFQDELAAYGDGKENCLPFDLHAVRALIAPRALICLEGMTDEWSDYHGGEMARKASAPVFRLYGKEKLNAVSYDKCGHAFTAAMWVKLLDFCDQAFYQRR